MDKIPTKEKILDASLILFSDNGYEGTSVEQIADAVGIKAPSLYKHFRSKEEIYNALVDGINRHYAERMEEARADVTIPDSLEELKEFSLRQIAFTMNDPTIIRVRKLITTGQYTNPHLSDLADAHFINDISNFYRDIFKGMCDKGIIDEIDFDMSALEYISPITLMIHQVDRNPGSRQYAMEIIERHIDWFLEGLEKGIFI